jgi:CBS domain-containing membrane protein
MRPTPLDEEAGMTSNDQEIRVRDLMTTALYTLHPEQSLPLADSIMERCGIRHIPVVDAGNALVGLVTHRDLLSAKISSLAPISDEDRSSLQLPVPVSRIMRTSVWTITPDTLAVTAARLMRDHRIGCLPVVEGRDLVGIVTEADLLALVTDSLSLGRATGPWTVERAMTPAPITIDSATTIKDAREVMARYAVRHLPVVYGTRVGMVSDRDLGVAEVVFSKATGPVTAAHATSLVGHEPVRRVQRTALLEDVMNEMFRERLDAVLVLDGVRLVGILTASDACRLLGEHLANARPASTRRLSA